MSKKTPVQFSQEVADALCQHIANGDSLRVACRKRGMPSVAGVIKWLADKEKNAFVAQYTRAREVQAERNAEEIVDIADTEPDVQRAKVRIDARKWVASKLVPKKYGDRMALEGPDGGPLQFTINRVNQKPDG